MAAAITSRESTSKDRRRARSSARRFSSILPTDRSSSTSRNNSIRKEANGRTRSPSSNCEMSSVRNIQEGIVNSQIWKSVFRVGIPNTNRKRVLAVLGSLILHLHPGKVRRAGGGLSYTRWLGGGAVFFFFVATVKRGHFMFYHRS